MLSVVSVPPGFLNAATGAVAHEIIIPDDPYQRTRWLDFALAPKANRLVVAGIDTQRQGFVEIWSVGSDAGRGADVSEN